MIKPRLIRLLSDSGKYIVFQVLWQWLSLLAQILAIWQVSELLGAALDGSISPAMTGRCAAVVCAVIV